MLLLIPRQWQGEQTAPQRHKFITKWFWGPLSAGLSSHRTSLIRGCSPLPCWEGPAAGKPGGSLCRARQGIRRLRAPHSTWLLSQAKAILFSSTLLTLWNGPPHCLTHPEPAAEIRREKGPWGKMQAGTSFLRAGEGCPRTFRPAMGPGRLPTSLPPALPHSLIPFNKHFLSPRHELGSVLAAGGTQVTQGA